MYDLIAARSAEYSHGISSVNGINMKEDQTMSGIIKYIDENQFFIRKI